MKNHSKIILILSVFFINTKAQTIVSKKNTSNESKDSIIILEPKFAEPLNPFREVEKQQSAKSITFNGSENDIIIIDEIKAIPVDQKKSSEKAKIISEVKEDHNFIEIKESKAIKIE